MAVYVGLLLATSAVVGATGHLGGSLVYGEDYLTSVLPWNERATPAVVAPVLSAAVAPAAAPLAPRVEAQTQAAAIDFARDVMPILKETCVECHGPDKVKARLRMDSIEALQKGGKSGALLKAGDPENSLIMRRVLGLDGDDQMPLDKDPLTDKQVDTLRRWIAAGAVRT
jgi:mono/diheme cytochrome c family protein